MSTVTQGLYELSFPFLTAVEDPSTRPHLHLIGQNYATGEPERPENISFTDPNNLKQLIFHKCLYVILEIHIFVGTRWGRGGHFVSERQ